MSDISDSQKELFYDMFVEKGRNPGNTLEGKMARVYHSAQEALERADIDFDIGHSGWSNEQLSQLTPENDALMLEIDKAQKKLEEIEFAIADFIDLVESYSRAEAYEELRRYGLYIANSRRRARNVRKKAIKENPNIALEEIDNLEVVKLANSERDQIISELKPRIAELKWKLTTSTEILLKYTQHI